jgi:hypothetical protein
MAARVRTHSFTRRTSERAASGPGSAWSRRVAQARRSFTAASETANSSFTIMSEALVGRRDKVYFFHSNLCPRTIKLSLNIACCHVVEKINGKDKKEKQVNLGGNSARRC